MKRIIKWLKKQLKRKQSRRRIELNANWGWDRKIENQ